MTRITSKYIDIPGMNNTRDLGGMCTKDGRTIRPNMLYRSSKLGKLEDKDWFTRNVALVVDMRSSMEINENPDPHITGVGYLHLPIFEMQVPSITRKGPRAATTRPTTCATLALKATTAIAFKILPD